MQQGYVKTQVSSKGIAKIIFFHPMHNSLPGSLLQSMIEAIQHLGSKAEVKVIVLESAEHKTFCSGASFDELVAIHDMETAQRFFSGFGAIINAMRKCPKIIVGRIHGKAVGGGVGLAAAVDYCFATEFSAVRLSELAVGFGPFVIGPAVERKIGLAAFSQMALTPGVWQTAEWALQKGLFQEIFEDAILLDAHIEKFCEQLAASSPEALYHLKTIFWQGTDHWDTLLEERAAISGELSLSDFTKREIAKFKAK